MVHDVCVASLDLSIVHQRCQPEAKELTGAFSPKSRKKRLPRSFQTIFFILGETETIKKRRLSQDFFPWINKSYLVFG
jgi:hypothetical protein